MNYNEEALLRHKKYKGKVSISSRMPLETKDDLCVAYTPGVAEPCRKIHENPDDAYTYTAKGHMVAIVSDGTAVLGLGDIGPKAAIPVMEGKAVLFKKFADVDAVPICLDTKDPEEIIRTVKACLLYTSLAVEVVPQALHNLFIQALGNANFMLAGIFLFALSLFNELLFGSAALRTFIRSLIAFVNVSANRAYKLFHFHNPPVFSDSS